MRAVGQVKNSTASNLWFAFSLLARKIKQHIPSNCQQTRARIEIIFHKAPHCWNSIQKWVMSCKFRRSCSKFETTKIYPILHTFSLSTRYKRSLIQSWVCSTASHRPETKHHALYRQTKIHSAAVCTHSSKWCSVWHYLHMQFPLQNLHAFRLAANIQGLKKTAQSYSYFPGLLYLNCTSVPPCHCRFQTLKLLKSRILQHYF